MRVRLSLAAVFFAAVASAATGQPSCPEGFEAVALGQGRGTAPVTITEDLLTRA